MRELVHIDAGRVSFSQAVGRVAAALSPLGAAAFIVAELSACVVEIRQLENETRRIHTVRDLSMAMIEQRRESIAGIFLHVRSQLDGVRVEGNALRAALEAVTRVVSDPHLSEDERTLAHGTMQTLTGAVVSLRLGAGDQLIRLADTILGNNGALSLPSWPELGR